MATRIGRFHIRMKAKRTAQDALSMQPVPKSNSGNTQGKITAQICGKRGWECRKLLILWWS
jgi:hypothetical protein